MYKNEKSWFEVIFDTVVYLAIAIFAIYVSLAVIKIIGFLVTVSIIALVLIVVYFKVKNSGAPS